MDDIQDFSSLGRLIDAARLTEQSGSLEDALTELARLTAQILRTDRCSILLRSDLGQSDEQAALRIFAYFGSMPEAALRETVRLNKGIAGHVMATGRPLLVSDIHRSPFVQAARRRDSENPSFISAPIEVASRLVGVLNVSGPRAGAPLTERDLELMTIFALFVGKSIQTFQLQKLAESRILQLAILREREELGASKSGSHSIAPEPARLVKLVAKSLYRELTSAGFGAGELMGILTEVLTQIQGRVEQDGWRR